MNSKKDYSWQKKASCLVFFIFLFSTETKELDSMEQEIKKEKEGSTTIEALLKINPSLPTDIAKIIVMYKHSIEEGEKREEETTRANYYTYNSNSN